MLSREKVQDRDPEDKAHAARFLYMPESAFLSKGAKKYYVDFGIKKARDSDTFLGLNLRELRERSLPHDDKKAMKFQVGKTELL